MACAQALVHVSLHEPKYSSDLYNLTLQQKQERLWSLCALRNLSIFVILFLFHLLPFFPIQKSHYVASIYPFFWCTSIISLVPTQRRLWMVAGGGQPHAAAGWTRVRAARSKQDNCGWSQTMVDRGREQWVTVGSCGWDAGCRQEWDEEKKLI